MTSTAGDRVVETGEFSLLQIPSPGNSVGPGIRSSGGCLPVSLNPGASPMIGLSRRAAIAVAALGLVAASLSATDGRAGSALGDGQAEGTLTVNGKTTKV